MGSSKVASRFNWFNPTPLKLSKHFEMKESFMGMHHEKPRFVHLIPLGSMLGPLLPYSLSPRLYEDCSQTCHLHVEYGGLLGQNRSNIRQKRGWMQSAHGCTYFILLVFNALHPTKWYISINLDQPSFNRQSLGNKPRLLSHTFTSPFDWPCVILASKIQETTMYSRKQLSSLQDIQKYLETICLIFKKLFYLSWKSYLFKKDAWKPCKSVF